MSNYLEENINGFKSIFKEGIKDSQTPLTVGLELEHFIIETKSKKTVSYYGAASVEVILEKLSKYYDEKIYSNGHLTELRRNDVVLSLEPGAQLEISIAPKRQINDIRKIYDTFKKEIESIIFPMGYELATEAYQPVTVAENIKLIPKKRYEYMDKYFSKNGPNGLYMMRGTASTQVSIDYYSEEDFTRKYRIAYILSPILLWIFSNTSVFEGKENHNSMLRMNIWERTDANRVDIEPYFKEEKLDFDSYIQFVLNCPIIINNDDEYDERPIRELCKERVLSKEELEHALSMVFPMVRLKRYIELRSVDSMPIEKVVIYLEVVKRLFENINESEALCDKILAGYGSLEKVFMAIRNQKFDKLLADEVLEIAKHGNMNSLEEEYMLLVSNNPKAHANSNNEVVKYMNNSTALYHGKPISSLYVPKIITTEVEKIYAYAAETMTAIMKKVIIEYRNNDDYQKLFEFEDKMHELIMINPGYDELLPIARVDIFFNERDYTYKFCEFNTDGSSSMNEDRELNNAFKLSKLYEQLKAKYHFRSYELFDTLVWEFEEVYSNYEKRVAKPNIAIVDFLELGCSMGEFEQFRLAFANKGYNAMITDVRELRYEKGKLRDKAGTIIHAIYRRAVTSDVLEHYEESRALINAAKAQAVFMFGSFCTQVAHDKSLFYILRDEMTKAILTDEENSFVKKHIPYTAKLERSLLNDKKIINNKDKWILKPRNSYGARGIYPGREFSKEEFFKLLSENCDNSYIIQEFIEPYKTYNYDFKDNKLAKLYSNLTGLYVYNGHFQGVYSRQSSTQIISDKYDENDIATVVVYK